jgi:hypothetical protein
MTSVYNKTHSKIGLHARPPDPGLTEIGPDDWAGFDELAAAMTAAAAGRAEVLVQPQHTLAGLGGCGTVSQGGTNSFRRRLVFFNGEPLLKCTKR